MVRVVCRSARDRPADQLQLQFNGLCRLCDDRVDVDGYMASETSLSVPDGSSAALGPQAEAASNTTTGERPYVVFGYGSRAGMRLALWYTYRQPRPVSHATSLIITIDLCNMTCDMLHT